MTWSLDTNTGVLTISGMINYTSSSGAPWYSYRNNITTALIDEGVTCIGNSAFSYCDSLTSVTIPDSVSIFSAANNYYAFDFEGLPAAEMQSVISAVVYDGESRISQTRRYSVDAFGVGKTGINLTLSQTMVAYGDAAAAYIRSEQ